MSARRLPLLALVAANTASQLGNVLALCVYAILNRPARGLAGQASRAVGVRP